MYLALSKEDREDIKNEAKEYGEGLREYIDGYSIQDIYWCLTGYYESEKMKVYLQVLNSRKGIDFTQGELRGNCQGEYLDCIVVGTWEGSKSKTHFQYVQDIFAGDVKGYVWEH